MKITKYIEALAFSVRIDALAGYPFASTSQLQFSL